MKPILAKIYTLCVKNKSKRQHIYELLTNQIGGGQPSNLAHCNCKAPQKPLLNYRKHTLYSLSKSLKRFYLGSWIFKLAFYRLTTNKDKAQKWKIKRDERYESLQLSLRLFKEFKKFYPQNKAWIESNEFKEKYLDTNHPYPPLLNPQNIDCKSISADLAWELNLPLPPNYDFIYITNGSSASEATFRFLEKCGVKTTHTIMIDYTPKGIFVSHFNIFKDKKSKSVFSGYTGGLLTNLDSAFFAYRLPKSVPLLYIARDPIEKYNTP